MRKNDARKLDHKTLEAIRIRAVEQVENGESPEAVIKALGMDRTCIYKWLAQYHEGGKEALKAKPLSGRPTLLAPEQVRWVYRTIVNKNPLQLKFEFALWTRQMVLVLIRERFGIELSLVSVGRLLARLGLTPQRPLFRAYQQEGPLVSQWLEKDFPRLRAKAKREGANIYFADEAGIRSDHHSGTTWAPKGETPVVKVTGQRFGLNMISAISPRGEMRFMVPKGKVNGDVFITFLKRLIHNAKRKIYLVVDGHPTHRAKKTRAFVDSVSDRLELVFLPAYSPELNPDELVWNDVKGKVGRSLVVGRWDLHRTVVRHLRAIQRNPRHVRSYFREKHVQYAM
jgi:transposase